MLLFALRRSRIFPPAPPEASMDTLLALLLGLGLAAAVGLRIFVPFLVISLAAHTGHLELAAGQEWIGTTPALVMFATATLLEAAAYQIPWVDHLLDMAAGPAAAVCGTVIMASAVVELAPLIKWPVAIIAGGGTAGLIRGLGSGARATSTVTTGGVANPVVAAGETAGSAVLSVTAVALPVLAGLLALALVAAVVKGGRRLLRRRRV